MNKESALSVARNDLHLSFSQRVGFGGFGFAGCKTNQFFLLNYEKRCSQDELGNKISYCVKESGAIIYIII
ncbi:MAG: hypothetical protein DRI23_05600 [Candidatus Cloacimonadota bacterium]|nr:MAG: hypothetical protein DRI23_05600 [Candidatus Cloacimonadota bacterium]